MKSENILAPQPGAQEAFLTSNADITIYGGAASGGKSWALLLDMLRWRNVSGFRGVVFRRTFSDIVKGGSLRDQAMEIYPRAGGKPREGGLIWEFPSGARVEFGYLQHDVDVMQWQGSELTVIAFDEAQLFTQYQVFYLLSRNRSKSSIKPYARLTCNPDCDSWLAEFISWWIGEEGYADPNRAGVTRWFVRIGDRLEWADRAEELFGSIPKDLPPEVKPIDLVKSVQFIPAKITDNKLFLSKNPEYYGALCALPHVERERLLAGNWKIRAVKGDVFDASWFEIVDHIPDDLVCVRFWDLAATAPKPGTDPDWCVGLLLARSKASKVYYILDIVRDRGSPNRIESLVVETAKRDGRGVRIAMEEEPGSSGKFVTANFAKLLDGCRFKGVKSTGPKVERARHVASQAQAGLVKMRRGHWNRVFLEEIGSFGTDIGHDDQGDALSGAHKELCEPLKKPGLFAWSFGAKPLPATR